MSKKNDNRKNIVIVGGGAGGSALGRALSKSLDASKYNLVVIDPRESLILAPSSIRLPVANPDGLEDKVFIPLKDIFVKNNGTFLQGKVVSIIKGDNGGEVGLENGDRIPYGALVLSPGSLWYGPFASSSDLSEVRAGWATNREQIKEAQNIVLIGAGAVGLELAGEIKSEYPHKSVTIVQGSDSVLNNGYPVKYRKAVEASVAAKNITFVPNEYVDDFEVIDGQVKTRAGHGIKADLVLPTHGPKPNTAFIGQSLGADVLSSNGYVKVEPSLQLLNHPGIFIIGDAVDNTEQKQSLKAVAHAGIVAKNVVAYLEGGALTPYKGSPEMIVLTLGKAGGVAYLGFLWGIILGDWFVRFVKSKNLLLPTLRGAYGLK